jgi:hypothetical protein
MLALTIDNPQVENYFANSTEKLKEFLERFVNDDTVYTDENAKQYMVAKADLQNNNTVASKEARSILGV